MTDNQVGELILVSLALIFMIRPRSCRTAPPRPEMIYFEMIEMIEVRKRPKVPQVRREPGDRGGVPRICHGGEPLISAGARP